jgi:hypothetical protein
VVTTEGLVPCPVRRMRLVRLVDAKEDR